VNILYLSTQSFSSFFLIECMSHKNATNIKIQEQHVCFTSEQTLFEVASLALILRLSDSNFKGFAVPVVTNSTGTGAGRSDSHARGCNSNTPVGGSPVDWNRPDSWDRHVREFAHSSRALDRTSNKYYRGGVQSSASYAFSQWNKVSHVVAFGLAQGA
jgi:hypothetical protein